MTEPVGAPTEVTSLLDYALDSLAMARYMVDERGVFWLGKDFIDAARSELAALRLGHD